MEAVRALFRLIRRMFRSSKRRLPVEVAERLAIYKVERTLRMKHYAAVWDKNQREREQGQQSSRYLRVVK